MIRHRFVNSSCLSTFSIENICLLLGKWINGTIDLFGLKKRVDHYFPLKIVAFYWENGSMELSTYLDKKAVASH